MRLSTAMIAAAVAAAACLAPPARSAAAEPSPDGSGVTVGHGRIHYTKTGVFQSFQDSTGHVMVTPVRGGPPVRTPRPNPHFPLVDLQINALDLAGAPADTTVYLVNTDVVADEQAAVPVASGVGRVAVPAGHYFALADFSDVDGGGTPVASREVVVNDFTVAPAPAVNAVTVDERTATSLTGATTPRPATQDASMLQLVRFDAAGSGVSFSLANLGGANPPLYISPTPAATVGKLHYVYQWDGAGDGYRYDLAFPSDSGIPAGEVFTARPDQLATVNQRFDLDRPGADPGSFLNGATDPALSRFAVAEVGSETGQPMPGQLTQYLGTADGGQWAQSVATPDLSAEYDGDPVVYGAGRGYGVSWGHGPLAPGFGNSQDPFAYCAACTAGGTLGLRFNELNDSEPTHTGQAGTATDHLVLSWNGKKIADEQDTGTETKLPSAKGVLRAVLDTDRTADSSVVHAGTTHTEMTVQVNGSAVAMPGSGDCAGKGPSTPCRILPALAVHYDLATDVTGTSTAAAQAMALVVSHLSYHGVGSHARITAATVSVSFDGRTWQSAKVTGSNGKYTARWSNPVSAKGSMPTLRVTATDADGNSINQTIADAYTYAGSA
jgi:hypothetical protein